MAKSATVTGVDGQHGRKCKPGDVIVRVDPRYFRPTEVETLLGDADQGQARSSAGRPRPRSRSWSREMVESDYTAASRDSLVKLAGFQAYDYNE